MKRALDIAVSGVLLVAALPVAGLVLVAMAADMLVCGRDRGGFVYRERRVSRGREFDLLKLRALRTDVLHGIEAPGEHARLYEVDAANLTWAGRRLLKPWYLDELPQLLNVLRGDMSLVGPRPWPPAMVAAQVARGVDYRLHVPAGWTGPAQVSKGDDVSFEQLDLAYVDRCRHSSGAALARYDAGILFQTVATLRRGEGLRF